MCRDHIRCLLQCTNRLVRCPCHRVQVGFSILAEEKPEWSKVFRALATVPNRDRGRAALSPSQPGLNSRSSRDNRTQSFYFLVAIATIAQLVRVQSRCSQPARCSDDGAAPATDQATDCGARSRSNRHRQLVAMTIPKTPIPISVVVINSIVISP